MIAGRWFRVALVVCALTAVFNASPAAAQAAPGPYERAVVREVNAVRAQAGLRPVRLSRPLSWAALAHSVDVARSGNFAHESSDGTSMFRRVLRFTRASYLAENLAFLSLGQDGPADVVAAWMASPGHRVNLLDRGFRRIGVGRAPGNFGAPGYVITADLASRR